MPQGLTSAIFSPRRCFHLDTSAVELQAGPSHGVVVPVHAVPSGVTVVQARPIVEPLGQAGPALCQAGAPLFDALHNAGASFIDAFDHRSAFIEPLDEAVESFSQASSPLVVSVREAQPSFCEVSSPLVASITVQTRSSF